MKYCLVLWIYLLPLALLSQAEYTTEEEVSKENLYLEALQQKILGNEKKAINLFERIVKEDRKNDAAFYQLASLYLLTENNEKAFENIQKAAKLDPDNTIYQLLLAEQYEAQNLYGSAALVYEQLQSDKMDDTQLLDKWAYALVKESQYDKAIELLEVIQQITGLSRPLTRKMYDIHMLQRRPAKALAVLESLSQSQPNNPDFLYLIGMHFKNLKKEDEAQRVFKQVIALDPDHAKANIALAGAFKQQGQGDAYIQSIQSLIENPAIDVNIKIKELIPYVEQLKEAKNESLSTALVEAANTLDRIHPDNAKVKAISGDLYYHRGEIDEAILAYKAAVQLQPEIWAVWEHLLYLVAERNQIDDLLRISEEGKDYYPNQAVLYYMSGLGLAKQKNYQDAQSALSEALLMVGKNVRLKADIYSLKGSIFAQQESPQKSDEFFMKAVDLNESFVPTITRYVESLIHQKRLTDAKEWITKGLMKENDHPGLIYATGLIAYAESEFEQAKDAIHKAIDLSPINQVQWMEKLGDAYYQLQQPEQAISYWQKALQLNPGNNILQQKIDTKQLIK